MIGTCPDIGRTENFYISIILIVWLIYVAAGLTSLFIQGKKLSRRQVELLKEMRESGKNG